jgi:hypothetical protein
MQNADTWLLTPFEQVGPLRLGTGRNQIIAQIGEPTHVLSTDPVLEEAHGAVHVQLVYDREERLLGVQTEPDITVVYGETTITGRQVDELRGELERAGITAVRADEGIDVPELGLLLYAPQYSDEAPPRTVLGVLAVRRDYHDVVGTP